MKRNRKKFRRTATLWLSLILMVGTVAATLFLYQNPILFPNTAVARVQGNAEEWYLILINKHNPVPEDYALTLTELKDGQAVDRRIYPALQQLFDAARDDGILPKITSSYRTANDQMQMMQEKITELEQAGYSSHRAKRLARQWVAVPGTSEHQIGIAVDISTEDSNLQPADVVWDWLRENSYQYGFILRYPKEKEAITGFRYEPWHFRYVGKTAAEIIFHNEICLEEYLYSYYDDTIPAKT